MNYNSFDDEAARKAMQIGKDFAGKITFPTLCEIINSQRYDIMSVIKHPVFDAYDVVLRFRR